MNSSTVSPYIYIDLAVLSLATSPEYNFASELLRRDRNVEKRMNAGMMTALNFIAYFLHAMVYSYTVNPGVLI